jgi:hypothetical protein
VIVPELHPTTKRFALPPAPPPPPAPPVLLAPVAAPPAPPAPPAPAVTFTVAVGQQVVESPVVVQSPLVVDVDVEEVPRVVEKFLLVVFERFLLVVLEKFLVAFVKLLVNLLVVGAEKFLVVVEVGLN